MVAATIATTVFATACTGGGRPGEALYSGPDVVAAENPFGVQWSWDTLGPIELQLADLAGGATVVDVVWCEVERRPGDVDFSDADARVGAAGRLGFRSLVRVRMGTCWASGHPDVHESPSNPPSDLGAYAAFVGSVAARYPEVPGFALEGALDQPASWAGPPGTYAAMVRPGAAAIRGAGTGASVFAAGVSSEGTGVVLADELVVAGRVEDAVTLWNEFYERRFAEPGSGYEAVASSADLGAALAGPQANRTRESVEVLASVGSDVDGRQLQYFERWQYLGPVVAALMRTDPSRRAYVGWELGLAWPGESYEDVIAADEIAKLLVEGLLLRLSPLVYRPAVSRPEDVRGFEVLRGLYLPAGAPKPAADVMETLVSAAAGPGIVVRRVSSGDLRGAGIGRGTTSTLVVWSDDDPVFLRGPAPPGVSAASAIGDPLEWSETGISIGSAPTVLVFPEPVGDAIRRVESDAEAGRRIVIPGGPGGPGGGGGPPE